jgi:hypothetical protein
MYSFSSTAPAAAIRRLISKTCRDGSYMDAGASGVTLVRPAHGHATLSRILAQRSRQQANLSRIIDQKLLARRTLFRE